MPTKKRTKKENAASFFSNWFKMLKTNKYVVHKASTSFFFSVKFEKSYLALTCGRLAVNSRSCAIFFFKFLFNY